MEREAQILKLARPILLREGFNGLSMDRLASLMEYAKGTIYNHFPNKEEIVLALAVESIELRLSLFEKAARSGANSRERLFTLVPPARFSHGTCPSTSASRNGFAIPQSGISRPPNARN